MNHEQYQEYVSRFIDRELGRVHSGELFQHLVGCGECRNFFQSAIELRTALQRSERPFVSEDLDRRILEMLVPARSQLQRLNSLSSLWSAKILFPLPAAASIAFLLIVGALLVAPMFFSPTEVQPSGQKDSPVLQELQRRGIIDRSLLQ